MNRASELVGLGAQGGRRRRISDRSLRVRRGRAARRGRSPGPRRGWSTSSTTVPSGARSSRPSPSTPGCRSRSSCGIDGHESETVDVRPAPLRSPTRAAGSSSRPRCRVGPPPHRVGERHHEERGGVDRAVVRHLRFETEHAHLADSQLVSDPARCLERVVVVDACPGARRAPTAPRSHARCRRASRAATPPARHARRPPGSAARRRR